MHRCLYISEIVAHIAQHALEVKSEHSIPAARDWRTVAALARTCTTLHNPASDVLWKVQVDLVNLVKCLPEDAWEERDIEPVGPDGWRRKLFFTRPLGPSDLQNIQHIAARIRSLYFLSASLTDWHNEKVNQTTHGVPFTISVLSKEALEELGRCHPTALMPKLRMLWLGDQYREEIFQSSILFSSTVQRVSMNAEKVDPRDDTEDEQLEPLSDVWQGLFTSALKHVQAVCPDIVELELVVKEGLTNVPIEFPGLDDVISDFVHLQILALEGVVPSFSTFSRIHLLPHLKELQMGTSELSTLVDGTTRAQAQRKTDQKSSLPSLNLNGLFIVADDDLSIIPVVSHHCMPNLRHFVALAWFEAPGLLMQTLHDHLDHGMLNSLQLTNSQIVDFDPEEDVAPLTLTGAMIVPLLVFRNLRTLSIHGRMSLRDDDLHMMAMAWPALEVLSMGSEFDVSPCQVTMVGLRHLVEHCPRLRVLGITFNLKEDEDEDKSLIRVDQDTTQGIERRGRKAQNWNITQAHVGASEAPVEMPHKAAAGILADLFPCLRTLDMFKDCDPPYWKLIEKYLPKNVDNDDSAPP